MQIGNTVEDFVLKDHNNKEFKLSEQKGKMVLLSFHPLAFTSVCAQQMKDLEASKKEFEELNVETVGVSVDSDAAKRAWAKELGVKKTKMLADFWPHGQVAKKLGLFIEEKGVSKRANVLIDENQKIVFFKVYEMSVVPKLDEIRDFIRKERKKVRDL